MMPRLSGGVSVARGARLLLCGAAMWGLALPALAAGVTVAVANFDYEDSSGEVANEAAFHSQHIAALTTDIQHALAGTGRFTAVPLHCGQASCSAGSLDQDAMVKAGQAQGARYIVFGGVHKMSTLIQWGRVDVMDAATGKSVLSRTITFRGDSADAWQHAADYIGQMLAQGLH